MSLPRMRTAKGVLDVIRTEDPDSQISLYLIRAAINSGAVPVVRSGCRMLVDADKVIAYLASGPDLQNSTAPGIRRVSAR